MKYEQLSFGLSEEEYPSEKEELSLAEKVEQSKKILRLACDMSYAYYNKPLVICYSMGKDSDTLLHLAETTLEPHEFEVLNSHTSVDFPESIMHRKEVFKRLSDKGIKCTVNYPKDENGDHITMWNLIIKRDMLPTRLARHCCSVLKETSTPNRMAAMGIRADESSGRKGRDVFGIRGKSKKEMQFYSFDHAEEVHRESQEIQDPNWDCNLIKTMKANKDTIVNPIYYWSDKDVWDYLIQNNVKTNPLYQKGYKRIGCIGCPMATYRQKQKQFADYPTYKAAYIHACNKLLEIWGERGKPSQWKTGEDMFYWWIEQGKYEVKGQISIFGDNDE